MKLGCVLSPHQRRAVNDVRLLPQVQHQAAGKKNVIIGDKEQPFAECRPGELVDGLGAPFAFFVHQKKVLPFPECLRADRLDQLTKELSALRNGGRKDTY